MQSLEWWHCTETSLYIFFTSFSIHFISRTITVCVRACKCLCMCMCVCVSVCDCVYVVYVCVLIYVCVCVLMTCGSHRQCLSEQYWSGSLHAALRNIYFTSHRSINKSPCFSVWVGMYMRVCAVCVCVCVCVCVDYITGVQSDDIRRTLSINVHTWHQQWVIHSFSLLQKHNRDINKGNGEM